MLPADTDPSEVHELEPSEQLPFPVRIPNATTVAALKSVSEREGESVYESSAEMLADLWPEPSQ